MSNSDATVLTEVRTTCSVARAFPNIALMKYWGKSDNDLHIPTTSSVSLTLDICPTTTSVAVGKPGTEDQVFFGPRPADAGFASRVSAFLGLVRALADDNRPAVVRTTNEIPTAAGLASSAAGFAALTTAAADAYGLRWSQKNLSKLARRGSGSATRSMMRGFSIWHRGEDDDGSYAEALPWSTLDLALVIVGVDIGRKSQPSGAAMRQTMLTSPFYWPWVRQSHRDLELMLAAGSRGDTEAIGAISERNALGMHATMLGADPPIRYMAPGSVEILDHVRQLRAEGMSAYCTMDAGPNVKIICRASDRERIADGVRERWPHYLCMTATAGPAAALIADCELRP